MKNVMKKFESELVMAAYAYTLLAVEKTDEAISIYLKLISQNPLKSLYWLNCSASYRSQKEPETAIKFAKSGLVLNPGSKLLRQALAQGYAEIGKKEQVKTLIKEDLYDEDINEQHLFNIQFLGEGYKIIESKELMKMAMIWEERMISNNANNMHEDRIKEKDREGKLKIGYLSADFNSHPVGRFMLPILRNHDKSKFNVHIISSTMQLDKVSEEIKKYSNQWLDIFKLADIDAARLVADLQLDILIELGGYTANSRLGVLCYRPCSVQLSYLGYFAPTYLKCIDGWLGDKILFENIKDIHHKSHKLLNIEGGYMAMPDIQEAEIRSQKRKICIWVL